MYGMVNDAIRVMVSDKLSVDVWKEVSHKASVSPGGFETFKQYDDSITLNLVSAVCEVTDQKAEVVLESFGEYWIEYAFKSEYAELLETFSGSPTQFISSLDSLHNRLEMSFNELSPPSFDIISEKENAIIVNYYSERDMPLEYFVKGLFKGIFDRFNINSEVTFINDTTSTAKATFEIKYGL